MKKIILTIFTVLFFAGSAFADAVYDNRGGVINGKIDGISDGIIQIKKDGNIITIYRTVPSPVYKDSIIVRKHLLSTKTIKYSGHIMFLDTGFVKILCQDTQIVVPRYKVKDVTVYVP